MVLKIAYKKILILKQKIKLFLFYRTKPKRFSDSLFNLNTSGSQIDIVTIAFNNDKMIEYQILLVKKYVNDSYTHIVADNSNNEIVSIRIEGICAKHDVLYVKIPFIKLKPSWSHAAALTWTYRNIIHKRNSFAFGFLDHDIFPIRVTNIRSRLENGVYGRIIPAYGANEINITNPYWSIWAGFCFFESRLFRNKPSSEINFFPYVIKKGLVLDTGGGLWRSILKTLPIPKKNVNYSVSTLTEKIDLLLQSDCYENIDEWVHIVNLSKWHKNSNVEKKIHYFEQLLLNKLN